MTIDNAIKQVKSAAKEKFDASVEVHINLELDTKKNDQQVRYTTTLPHGTGKELKVAVFASTKINNADLELQESDLAKIENGQIRPRVDFDVLISEPRMMPKLAKVAKILGPAGVMPNPKSGTVAEDIAKAVESVKKGKIEIKNEQAPIIHTIMGKVSFTEDKLKANFEEILNSLRQNRPAKAKPNWIKSIFIKSSMGKAVSVDL